MMNKPQSQEEAWVLGMTVQRQTMGKGRETSSLLGVKFDEVGVHRDICLGNR